MPTRATGTTKKSPSRARSAPPKEAVDLDLDEMPQSTVPSFKFRLAGQTFRCRNKDDLHWDTVEKWMIARASNDAGEIAVNIDGFFEAVLFPEDIAPFMELKRDPAGPLTLTRSEALLQDLNERLFGVPDSVDPTERPANSGGGSSQNGRGSKVEHDGRVTRRA